MASMYCPQCGKRLDEQGDYTKYFVRLFRCRGPACLNDYLHMSDMKWIYAPLYHLSPGVLRRFEAMSEESKGEALSKIEQIDYTTISLAKFEKFISKESE